MCCIALASAVTTVPAAPAAAQPAQSTATSDVDNGLTFVEPARLTDTRLGQPTLDGIDQGSGKLAAGSVHAVRIGGRANVPNDAAAAVINITATETDGEGYLTVYPCDDDQPNTSTLNYADNDTIAAVTVTAVDPGGDTCIYSHAVAHLVIDVTAYLPNPTTYTLDNTRLLDTRDTSTALAADDTARVAFDHSLETDSATALLNVAAVYPSTDGHLTIFPCEQTKPGTSNLNYEAGTTIANAALITLSTDDDICIHSFGATDVIVDLVATTIDVPGLSALQPVNAARLIDTRPDGASIDGASIGAGTIAAGTTTELAVAGRADIPQEATAVAASAIAIAGDKAGYLTVYSCTPERPETSNVNHGPGQTRTNLTFTELSPDGTICIYNSADTDLVIDLFAYQTAPTTPLAAAGTHTCTTTADGLVECWGNNQTGQLGNGTYIDRLTATPAVGIFTARAVTTGGAHTCSLAANATVTCWGDNSLGQLGIGTTSASPTPATVTDIADATAIVAGDSHTCALHRDNTISCWGSNAVGQLGNGTNTDETTPTAVAGIADAIRIAAAGDTTCVIRNDHTISCWGNNTYGQIGPAAGPFTTNPVPIPGIDNATDIAVGFTHICATTSTDTLCWGNNADGQLGNGTTTNTSTPTPVAGVDTVRHIAAGSGTHTCATTATGTYCWGNNSHGQTGQPTSASQTEPALVDSGINTFTRLSIGDRHTCALDTNRDTHCWGDNNSGQLGNNTTTDTATPTPTA